ncbi:MAG: hypothetical protein CME64_10320 [Halobacteriovoraceae bacterium]|nr:hypothetical protein [Halobacteriovoraceae bacterium]|tara:strand:+ start:6150 stop:7175 length:1026 start_codon:yes stop_codon:yes gene_type:complete
MLVFLLFLKHGFCAETKQAECNQDNNFCVSEKESAFERSHYKEMLKGEDLFGQIKHLDEDDLREIYRNTNPGSEVKQKQYFIPLGLTDTEKIASLAAASIGLVVFKSDQAILDFVQDNKNDVTHKMERFGYYAGRTGIAHLIAGSYLMGAIFDNGKLKDVGVLTLGSIVVSQTITEFFKVGFGRSRPRDADGDTYKFGTDGKSFFSGHSSGAFTAAAVLAEVYKDTPVPYIAYGLAGVVAYARVHEMGHYPSDVLYGAIAGILSANITMRAMRGDDSLGGIMVTPTYTPDPLTKDMTFNLNIKWEPKRPAPVVSCEDIEELGLSTRETVSNCMQKAWLLNN